MKIFRMRPFNSKDCLCFRLVLMFVLFVSFDVLAHSQTDIGKQDITHFIPKGYKLFDKIYGDLNQDGTTDCVLIIKAMRKDGFVEGDDGNVIDRNRRGIIILFSKQDGYELALKNYDCFSSENEDGGDYGPPELSINIRRGKLYVDYNYGRYGFWDYCFRYQDSDFALIGFDRSENWGATVFTKKSINFLTGTEYIDKNINSKNPDGKKVFRRKIVKMARKPLYKLSKIKDFDDLGVVLYWGKAYLKN